MATQPTGVSTDNDILQATVSGGLNLSSTALTLPANDSTDLLNVDIETDGSVVKRRGFAYESAYQTYASYVEMLNYIRLRNGYSIQLSVHGLSVVLNYRDTVANVYAVTRFDNAFGTNSNYKTDLDVIISNEPGYTKAIILRENHAPVQVLMIECSATINPGAPTTSFTIRVPSLYSDYVVTSANFMMCWIDGVYNQITGTYTYSSPNETGAFTVTNSISTGTHTVHLCYFTIQGWSEGNKVDVTQVVGQVTQGAGEIVKAVPSLLLSSIDEILNAGIYPIKVYKSTAHDDAIGIVLGGTLPVGLNQAGWSAGESVLANALIPSPFYVTFGATPGVARNIIFHRGYSVANYNGGRRHPASAFSVCLYNNTSSWILNSGRPASEGGADTGSAKYSFRLKTNNYLAEISPANLGYYITFDATQTASGGVILPQDDILLWGVRDVAQYNTEVFGTGYATVSSDLRKPKNQYGWVVFGIQDFCQYNPGGNSGATVSFPATGCIFQRRLALAGMPSAPNLIAFSEVQDATIPGQYYRNFQTLLENGDATNGFYTILPTENNERIVAMREFQGSLFVWTNLSLYRLNATQGNVFSDGAVDVNRLAGVGCLSVNAVVTTANSIYWLSRTGVYGLVPNDTAGGYGISQISQKVRRLFTEDLTSYPELSASMCYDNAEQRLYVSYHSSRPIVPAYSTSVGGTLKTFLADSLLVYHEFNDAWTKYSGGGGLNYYHRNLLMEYESTTFKTNISESTGLSNLYVNRIVTNSGTLYIGKQPRYIDQYGVISASTGTFSLSVPFLDVGQYSFTTAVDLFTYNPSDIVQYGIQLLHVTSFVDCIVSYAGTPLTFGVDYVKTVDGAIQLLFNPTAGQDLTVTVAQRINGGYHSIHGVYLNGEPRIPGLDYTALNASSTGITVINTDVVRFGTTYPSYHYSATFTRSTLANWKRIKQWVGYYDSSYLGDKWKVSEVGGRYDLIGLHKNQTNFDLLFLFNNEQDGYIDDEVFGASQLTWDEAQLSLGAASQQYKPYARITVPIVGGGYAIQFVHFSNSINAFKFSGFQLIASLKPGKGVGRTE